MRRNTLGVWFSPAFIAACCLGFGPWACSGGQSFDDGTDALSATAKKDAGPESSGLPASAAGSTAGAAGGPAASVLGDAQSAQSDGGAATSESAADAGASALPGTGSDPNGAGGQASGDATGGAGTDAGSPPSMTGGGETTGTGGANAMGGAPTDASVSEPNVACIDVSNTDDRQQDDLRVVGTGFDEYDGQVIRVLVTLREPSYGLGEVRIEGGAFDLLLPGVLGDYTGIAVHVDTIRNSACDPDSEFIWQMTTGPAPGDTVWEVTPETLRISDQVGPCSLNGVFDLQTPTPCATEG